MRISPADTSSFSDLELLAQSKLFDPAFYLDQYPDVAAAGVDPIGHYLAYGAGEGRRPHPAFDGNWYLRKNPDAGQTGSNPLVHYLRKGMQEGRRAHKSTVVYTAIIGLWDDLRVPITSDPDIDYVVFADEQLPAPPKPWLRRKILQRFGNARLTSRFVKATPHLHVPEYQLSLWMDGAFQLRSVTQGMLESLAGSAPIATFHHSVRNCAYAEAEVVRTHGLDAPERIDRAVKLLKDHGFPAKAGLCEAGLLLRRHHDPDLIRAMDDWWNYLGTTSCRDQLTLNFALWQNQVSSGLMPGTVRRNQLGYWMGHRPNTEADMRIRLIEHEREMLYLYQQIECSLSHLSGVGGSV